MKRIVVVFLMVVIASALLPALASATEAAPVAATTAATVATSALITYPAPEPLATAEEAYAETEWMKSGDGLNLIVALLSLGAIGGIVVWAILAQRRVVA